MKHVESWLLQLILPYIITNDIEKLKKLIRNRFLFDNLKSDIHNGGIFMAQSILIVDDEKEIVSMLYCYFSKLGYTVYTATAGNAALKEVEKKPWHYFVRCQYARYRWIYCLRYLSFRKTKGIVLTGNYLWKNVWGD